MWKGVLGLVDRIKEYSFRPSPESRYQKAGPAWGGSDVDAFVGMANCGERDEMEVRQLIVVAGSKLLLSVT